MQMRNIVMKPKLLSLLERCIEDGIALGYNRAFKHNDSPSKEEFQHEIHKAIMNEIYEWFDFPENYDE